MLKEEPKICIIQDGGCSRVEVLCGRLYGFVGEIEMCLRFEVGIKYGSEIMTMLGCSGDSSG